jgi:hypothetical protein
MFANNFIMRALEENKYLPLDQLQWLIYSASKEYTELTGKKLFSELLHFETDENGTVSCSSVIIESMFYYFMPYKDGSINRFYRDCMGEVHIISETDPFVNTSVNNAWKKFK